MIQFNKTIFQFTKRLALVVMLIGISSVAYGGEWFPSYYYSRVKAQATVNNTSAANLVYVSESQITGTNTPSWDEASTLQKSDYTTESDATKANEAGTWQLSEGATEKWQEGYTYYTLTWDGVSQNEKNMSHRYHLYAKKDANYLFAGWYNGDTSLKEASEYAEDVTFYEYIPTAIKPNMTLTSHTTTDERGSSNDKYTFTFDNPTNFDLMATAKYLVPAVVSVENQVTTLLTYDKTITYEDPTVGTSTTISVEFGVQSALAKENFTLVVKDKDNQTITIDDNQWSYANDKVTINVPITLSGNNTESTKVATVTLTSKYKGSADTATTYTCNVYVSEEYVPRFYVEKESKVFRSQGEESNVDEFIATKLNATALHSNTQWHTEIIGPDAGCFSFISNPDNPSGTSKNTHNPRIKFQYTGEEKNEYSAELHIYCMYNTTKSEILDANGDVISDENNVVVQEKIIYLSARFDPVILFNDHEDLELPLTTFIATATDEEVNVAIPYRHNLPADPEKESLTLNPENTCITFGELPEGESGEISITVNKNTNPGIYEATLSVSGKGENEEGQEVDIDASIKAQVRIELATPTLNATPGDDKVDFTWDTIPHANKYVIAQVPNTGGTWSDADLIGKTYQVSLFTGSTKTTETTSTSLSDESVNNDTWYYYCVVALYVDGNNEIVDSKTSTVVEFMPSNTPKTITLGTSLLNIYTGTMDGHPNDESQFPLRQKRQVNVSAAFDKSGRALFNRLFIFGQTTGEDGNELSSISSPTGVKTPCYVYEYLNATTYQYVTTIENMNTDSKHSALTINAGAGMKYYFTGYCPFATTGSMYSENGVVQIIGSGQVDVYLDNLQLYSCDKSDESFEINIANIPILMEPTDKAYASYPLGSGAVFAFTPANTNTFTPSVHIRENNILDATAGLTITKSAEITTADPAIPSSGVAQYSAPIQILPQILEGNPIGANTTTELMIDDKWISTWSEEPTQIVYERTNGAILLQENHGGKGDNDWTETNTAPSIDLGLASSKLTLNGGQITMNNSTYSNKLSVARLQSSLYLKVEASGQVVERTTTFYGVAFNSEDYSKDNSVSITDGTINNGNSNALILPTNTRIDGGTFNCNITAIDSDVLKNRDGKELGYFDDIVVGSWDVTNANGTANTTRFNEMMDYLFPHAGVNDENNYHRSLSMYYVNGKTYGHESLQPDADGKIKMFLPILPIDSIHFAWQICSPNFSANINGVPRPLGGGISNINSCGVEGHASYTIDYLLYMEMDEYTRTVAKNKSSISMDSYNIQVTVDDDDLHKSIDNTAEYEIQDKVYMLKPVVAGEWNMFVAPFDVTNIYVIEAYPDAQIKKDYGKSIGYGDYIIEQHNVEYARQAQAKRVLDLYTFWYLAEKDMDTASDFWGTGTYTDENGNEVEDKYGVFVDAWIAYETSQGKDGNAPADDSNYTPVIEPLYHYTGNKGSYPEGMKWWDAHYYLYKSNDKKWLYTTPEGDSIPKLVTDWEIVKTQAGGTTPIMTKGNIYTMQFPAAINSTNRDWNYWTGKYILLEGNGQIINGSDSATTTVTPNENEAYILGNASFANLEVEKTNGLFQLNKNENNVYNFDLVEEAISQINVKPTYGYMLANIPITTTTRTNDEGQTVQVQKIAKSIRMETGEVVYETRTTVVDNNGGDITSGVPTIMGNLTLVVEPTAEGLTITPLKEQHVMLFDAEGKMIFSERISEEVSVSLPTGVYVVRGEYEQVKAIKK